MQLSSGDLDLAQQPIGIRFTTITIPPGALITNAYLELTAEDSATAVSTITILGEASDDAAIFTTTRHNITNRPTTAASVAWSLPAWTSGQTYQSPDIAPLIQEIVNRPGWGSGQNLALILAVGIGERDAVSFDQNNAAAPLLHVEYTSSTNELSQREIVATNPTYVREQRPFPPKQRMPSWN